jgi:hypothetical protein
LKGRLACIPDHRRGRALAIMDVEHVKQAELSFEGESEKIFLGQKMAEILDIDRY